MKQKMNLRQELDLTRDGTAEMTRWCIIIALHQCFGVGKDRLNRIELRAEELGLESLNIAMQANGKGMPSTDQSRAMRDNWMPEGVEPEFRVPVLRAPRTRREQQLRMAGDVAASMVLPTLMRCLQDSVQRGARPIPLAVLETRWHPRFFWRVRPAYRAQRMQQRPAATGSSCSRMYRATTGSRSCCA